MTEHILRPPLAEQEVFIARGTHNTVIYSPDQGIVRKYPFLEQFGPDICAMTAQQVSLWQNTFGEYCVPTEIKPHSRWGYEINQPYIPGLSAISRSDLLTEPYLRGQLMEILGLNKRLIDSGLSYDILGLTEHQKILRFVAKVCKNIPGIREHAYVPEIKLGNITYDEDKRIRLVDFGILQRRPVANAGLKGFLSGMLMADQAAILRKNFGIDIDQGTISEP